MRTTRVATRLGLGVLGIMVAVGAWQARAGAQDLHAQHHGPSGPRDTAGALVRIVREATERFRDPAVAENAGYNLMFGCVSGPDVGAMGLHYVNLGLVGDAELDP